VDRMVFVGDVILEQYFDSAVVALGTGHEHLGRWICDRLDLPYTGDAEDHNLGHARIIIELSEEET